MALAVLAFASCKTESKLSRYKDIYAEKPVTIYITPTIDQAERPNKKITDKSYNNQLDVARHYMRHSLMKPFETKGYYVFGPLVSAEIAKADSLGECHINDTAMLKHFADKYGVDAVLFTFIYKWEQKGDDWYVYVEYFLKSTKTCATLLNTKMKAGDVVAFDYLISSEAGWILIDTGYAGGFSHFMKQLEKHRIQPKECFQHRIRCIQEPSCH